MYLSKSYLSPLLVLLFILVSCKKEPIQYTFTGNISDRLIGTKLDGVEVKISQRTFDGSVLGTAFQLVGNSVTDENGDFEISFDRDKVTSFLIECEKDNYFPINYEKESSGVSSENTNRLDEKMDAKAWIKFDILNQFGEDTDQFKIIKQTFREGCEGCAVNNTITFNGLIDTSITYLTTGGEYVKFVKVNVTSSSSQLDSIYATPFETTSHSIVY